MDLRVFLFYFIFIFYVRMGLDFYCIYKLVIHILENEFFFLKKIENNNNNKMNCFLG
jgi:hypothetical protein